VSDPGSFEIQNSADSEHVPAMVDYLYKRLQRRGYHRARRARMVNQDRNVFASLLVALGHGDGMITGMTRTFARPCAR
jgi:malate dehydrogenase (oxaloacetate-decarboxylating)(NADP+)